MRWDQSNSAFAVRLLLRPYLVSHCPTLSLPCVTHCHTLSLTCVTHRLSGLSSSNIQSVFDDKPFLKKWQITAIDISFPTSPSPQPPPSPPVHSIFTPPGFDGYAQVGLSVVWSVGHRIFCSCIQLGAKWCTEEWPGVCVLHLCQWPLVSGGGS